MTVPAPDGERSIAAAPASRGPIPPPPSLRHEKRLLRQGHVLVAGCDEVGRGALAGPVTVGLAVVDASVRRSLAGVHDSKLLRPAARQALVPRIQRWAVAHAVGHASAGEVDRWGLLAALCLAAHRALARLPTVPDVVLLDGNHDWLSALPPWPAAAVADDPLHPGVPPGAGPAPSSWPAAASVAAASRRPAPFTVVTAVKADQRCASVAAASVLAKTTRDALMVAMADHHPGYGWHQNKGYASADHRQALARLGPCPEHRRTWRLPGVLSGAAAGPDVLSGAAAGPGVLSGAAAGPGGC